MIEIGKMNSLQVLRNSGGDFYLGTGTSQLALLLDPPAVPLQIGETLEVFVYVDVEGHLAATTTRPRALVDECAWLKVVSVTKHGAFLDWGLRKDLLVPHGEQYMAMREGRSYLVRLFLDDQNRLLATTKINRFLAETSAYFKVGDKVSLLIAEETDLGFKAIINHSHWGMLYHDDLFQKIKPGEQYEGYIRYLREDLKINLSLQEPGYGKVETLTGAILAKLEAVGGELALSDKSPPEAIYAMFGVSKKAYKQAIGALYKDQKILLEKTGIKLLR